MRLTFIYRRTWALPNAASHNRLRVSDCIKFLIILVYPRMVRHWFREATDRYEEDAKVWKEPQPRLQEATIPKCTFLLCICKFLVFQRKWNFPCLQSSRFNERPLQKGSSEMLRWFCVNRPAFPSGSTLLPTWAIEMLCRAVPGGQSKHELCLKQ